MKQYRVTEQIGRGYNNKTWDATYGFLRMIDNLKGAEKRFEEAVSENSHYPESLVRLQERSGWFGKWRTIKTAEKEIVSDD
jgi:hypothetical protein